MAPLFMEWQMTTLRREWLAAGASVSGRGGLWALVLAGAATLETADGASGLRPGDALLVQARTAHRLTADADTELVHGDLWSLAPAAALPSPLVVRRFDERQRGVVALVTACPLDVICRKDPFAASYAGLIGAAMSLLASDDADAGGSVAADVDTHVACVVAALAARPGGAWTLDGMAALVHLSRSALTERFRRATGHSPMRVLRDVRMNRARTLLAEQPDLPVTRVAFEVGYGSVAAFSRAFTADHGVSPLAWRVSAARHPQGRPAEPGRDRGRRADQQQRLDAVAVQ